MAKRLFLCVLILLFGFLSNSYAVPQYFTFEGSPTSIFDDAGFAADAGISLGTNIEYVFLVDFDEPALITQNGVVTTLRDGNTLDGDGNIMYATDRFYCDFIGGTVMESPLASVDEAYNSGRMVDSRVDYHDLFQLQGRSLYDMVSISFEPITEVIIGSNFWSWNRAVSESGSQSQINGVVTLTGISDSNPYDVAPVPEPSTIVLMGLGLVGLAGFGRKKFKK